MFFQECVHWQVGKRQTSSVTHKSDWRNTTKKLCFKTIKNTKKKVTFTNKECFQCLFVFRYSGYETFSSVWFWHPHLIQHIIWAGPWENVSYVICEQQRSKSACASAQSDQRLSCSLLRYYNISRFYSRNFKTLASFCGCAGRFVSGRIGNSRIHVLSCRAYLCHLVLTWRCDWSILIFKSLLK